MKRPIFALSTALILFASPAFAHVGIGPVSGVAAGFSHPLGGLDHTLAMIAVGILAARLGGRALWAVPAAFIGMMIVGGVLGATAVPLPFVELGITGSIVVLGFVIALGRRFSVPAAMALVGVMAVFHGHAHGTEMPATVGGLEYGAGFVMATALLHATGVAIGIATARMGERLAPLALRLGGGLIAAAGLVLAAS